MVPRTNWWLFLGIPQSLLVSILLISISGCSMLSQLGGGVREQEDYQTGSLFDELLQKRGNRIIGIAIGCHLDSCMALKNAEIQAKGNLAKEISVEIQAVSERMVSVWPDTLIHRFRQEIMSLSHVVLPRELHVETVRQWEEERKICVVSLAQIDRTRFVRSLAVRLDRRALLPGLFHDFENAFSLIEEE